MSGDGSFGSLSSRSELRQVEIVTTDVNGSATFIFPLIAPGQTWIGTIKCVTAIATAQFTLTSQGSNLGAMKGTNSFGPIILEQGDQLVATATGLLPSTPYPITLNGYAYAATATDPVAPFPYADVVDSRFESFLLGTGTATSSANITIGPVPITPTVKYVWIVVNITSSSFSGQPFGLITVPGSSQTVDVRAYSMPSNSQTSGVWRVPIPTGGSLVSIGVTSNAATNWTYTYGVEMGVGFEAYVYNNALVPLFITNANNGVNTLPLLVGGSDGTNTHPLATDSSGHLLTNTFANPYPSGANSTGGSTGLLSNAAGTASLAAVASMTNWLTGFEVTYTGATAGSTQLVTVTGLAQGTLNYVVTVPAGASVAGNDRLIVSFPFPLPAVAVNTAVTLSVPAAGAGGFGAGNIHGYYL